MFSFVSNIVFSLLLVNNVGNINHIPTTTAGGYKIHVKINGVVDSTCYLAHYYGQYQQVDDTAVANSKGEMFFEGKNALPGGIYFVVIPKKKYFDFVIDKEQEIWFETDTADLVKNMKVKGSTDNKNFYEYVNFVSGNQALFNRLKTRLDANKDNKDSTELIKKEVAQIDERVKSYKLDFITKYPTSLPTKVFLASKEPEIPETPLLPNGRKDSTFAYRFYKAHYWDNIDLTDDRILRTPVFYTKLSTYFDKIVVQSPDSIIKEADMLIEKCRPNKEMFKYMVWWVTYTYETSKVMGFDAVFVHMVETYYMKNQCDWLSDVLLKNITDRAMKLKPILLGKVAPNMVMQDTSLQLQSMQAIKARYTVLAFWDYNCGHCKTEIPKLVEFYNAKKKELGIEIFAVCTDTSMAEMKKFIRANKMNFINVNGPRSITPKYADLYDIFSTPVIFVLDDKKTIVAKRIDVEQIEEVIRHDIMMKDVKK
ncbi:MAG: redoxin domain-containing protein [Bacteroidota bacterium]